MTDKKPHAGLAESDLPERSKMPKPDPEGIATPVSGEGVWVKATIVELHDSVVVISLPREGGGDYQVAIDNPPWNCDPSRYQAGDTVEVRGEVQVTGPSRYFVLGGRALFVAT